MPESGAAVGRPPKTTAGAGRVGNVAANSAHGGAAKADGAKKKKNFGKIENGTIRPRMNQSKTLGVTLPVSRVNRRLRNGRYAKRVGVGAAVYLTGVVEFLLQELLANALEQLQLDQKHGKSITPRHIQQGIAHDEEFKTLLDGVTITRGGISRSGNEINNVLMGYTPAHSQMIARSWANQSAKPPSKKATTKESKKPAGKSTATQPGNKNSKSTGKLPGNPAANPAGKVVGNPAGNPVGNPASKPSDKSTNKVGGADKPSKAPKPTVVGGEMGDAMADDTQAGVPGGSGDSEAAGEEATQVDADQTAEGSEVEGDEEEELEDAEEEEEEEEEGSDEEDEASGLDGEGDGAASEGERSKEF